MPAGPDTGPEGSHQNPIFKKIKETGRRSRWRYSLVAGLPRGQLRFESQSLT